jgi:hypothetical protein
VFSVFFILRLAANTGVSKVWCASAFPTTVGGGVVYGSPREDGTNTPISLFSVWRFLGFLMRIPCLYCL